MDTPIGPHIRPPWKEDDPKHIHIHGRWDELKGTYKRSGQDQAKAVAIYREAKEKNNIEAALNLVVSLIKNEVVDVLAEAVVQSGKPSRIVFPHPEFDSDIAPEDASTITNAIPFAFGAYLAERLGGEVESEIIECARPGRTKLNRFQRFIWQPRFSGGVSHDVAYILVDDVCTMGGTLASLRSHILSNGGTVIAACALCNKDGVSCRFGITPDTNSAVVQIYSSGVSQLWKKEIGHDIECLTENEGSFLASWERRDGERPDSALQRLRDRLDKAKAQGK